MIPATLNLTAQAGDTFSQLLTWMNPPVGTAAPVPVDLTGCVANMSIAQNYGDKPMLTLSSSQLTPNGSGLTLGGTAGTIQITITPADSAALQSGVYDLPIEFSNGTISRPVAGSFSVLPEVTVWP